MRLVNVKPDRAVLLVLAALPFALMAGAYFISSALRLSANSNDKLLPALDTMANSFGRMAFVADPRTGDYLLWTDTLASLERLLAALAIATVAALLVGIAVGLLPIIGALLRPFVSVASMVPPLALFRFCSSSWGSGKPRRSR